MDCPTNRSPLPVTNARTLIEDKTGTQGCSQQVHIMCTLLHAFACQRIIIALVHQIVPNVMLSHKKGCDARAALRVD
jgi:hypothetical protein